MAEREKNSSFEEVNPFPEKVSASTSDDSDVIYWDPDDRNFSGSLEETRPVSAGGSTASRPIVDEAVSGKDRISVRPREAGSPVEELARDIDSLELPSAGSLSGGHDDFLSVLDDHSLNLIDEVVDKSSEYVDIDALDRGSTVYSDVHSEVSLIDEERLIESKPLWADDDDFWVNDAEGFDVPPHELLSYLASDEYARKRALREAPAEDAPMFEWSAEEAAPAEPAAPFPDKPYILKADSEEITIDVAALIDPVAVEEAEIAAAAKAAEKKTERKAREERPAGDVDIPFVVIGDDEIKDIRKTDKAPRGPVVRGGGQPGERKPPADKPRAAVGAEKPEKREAPAAPSRLPENFSITHIDLSEAEKIAKEDIFILSEEDLIEELEQIDLVPVSDMHGMMASAPVCEERVSSSLKGEFTWLTPEESAVSADIKRKIESDIQSPSALVVEEDIRDIREKLSEYAEADEEESLVDITDRVVLMEDESDVDRFMSGIPEAKRGEMKKLLTYLDGLFEKLPEDVVKKFADSEYFDLYVKIMNDLGE